MQIFCEYQKSSQLYCHKDIEVFFHKSCNIWLCCQVAAFKKYVLSKYQDIFCVSQYSLNIPQYYFKVVSSSCSLTYISNIKRRGFVNTQTSGHHIPSNSCSVLFQSSLSFLWTTGGALLNTNQAELFWYCMNSLVRIFLVSTLAEWSSGEQHFDNDLREILQGLHTVVATRLKSTRAGFSYSSCRMWILIN